MMLRSILVLLLALSFSLSAQTEFKNYGKEITLQDTTSIQKLLQNPEAWVGQPVLVQGRIVAVCENRGCWMNLAAENGEQSIKIKVNDGEIVFPLDAKGKVAQAQGVFEKLVFSVEEVRKIKQHEAEEHKTTFDPATVTEGMTIYRIKGQGARIFQ